jgi:multidrug resistance efflux pump
MKRLPSKEILMMSKGRWRGVSWLLGAVLLVCGLTWRGLNYPRGIAGAEPTEPARPEVAVACFGHVDVKYGVTSLYPTQPGRVAEVMVEENQAVKSGALLLRLEDAAASLRVQEAQADLKAAQIQLVEARKRPRQHQSRLAQMRAAIEAVNNRLAAAQCVHAAKAELNARELIKYTDLAVSSAQVNEVEALLQGEREKLEELKGIDPASDIGRAEEEVKARKARLQQAQEVLKECCLQAPTDGKVLRVLVGRGEMLGAVPKQAAILFCPNGPRFIRAEVEQEFASRVQIGQQASIRDDSNEPTVWWGRVTALSDWYTQRRSVLQEPLQVNDVRTLECLIALDPAQPPMRIGQRVRVLIGRNP